VSVPRGLGGAPLCEDFACGVVFFFFNDTATTEIYTFDYRNPTPGYGPDAGVIRDSAGDVYGTTYFGGNINDCQGASQGEGCGVVFKITP
jgi:hypothetical protein